MIFSVYFFLVCKMASKNRSDASKNEYDNVTDDEINYLERPLLINNEDKSDPDQLTTLLGIRMKQSTKKEIEIAILMIVVIILGSANRVANKVRQIVQWSQKICFP